MENNEEVQMVERKQKKIPVIAIVILVILILGVFVWKSEVWKTNGVKFVELMTKDQYAVDMFSSRAKSFNNKGEKVYTATIKNNLLSMVDSTFSLIDGDFVITADVIRNGKNIDASGEISLGELKLQTLELVKENKEVALSVPNLYEGFLSCNIKNINDVTDKLEIYSGDKEGDYKEEFEKIIKKYAILLAQNINDYINVTKQSVSINQKELSAEKYTFSLDKKEMNALAIILLEKLKDDDETIEFITRCMNENERIALLIDGEYTADELKGEISDLYEEMKENYQTVEASGDIITINAYAFNGKNVKTELHYSGDTRVYGLSFETVGEKENDYALLTLNITDLALNIEFIGNKLDDNYTSEITIGTDGATVSVAEFNIVSKENEQGKIRKIADINAISLDKATNEEIEKIKKEIRENLGISEEEVSEVYESGEFKLADENNVLKVLDVSKEKYQKINPGMKREDVVEILGEPNITYGTTSNGYLGWYLENTSNVYLVSVACENDIVYAVYNDVASDMYNNIQISVELGAELADLNEKYDEIKLEMKKSEIEEILGNKYLEMYKDEDKNVAMKWYDKNENSLIIEFNENEEVSYIDKVQKDI